MAAIDTQITITGLRSRAVVVPINLGLQTSAGTVDRLPLVLLDLHTSAGVTGHSYLFAISSAHLKPMLALLDAMASMIEGQPLAPFEIERIIRKHYALLGVHNLVTIAMSGIDMAIWDALARRAGQPLVSLLGGRPGPVRAYNSCGLGIMPEAQLTAQVPALLERGFGAVKIRLGRPRAEDDLSAVAAVRKALGPDIELMADFNQGLTLNEALKRCRMLDAQGELTWIEEPITADNFAGCAQIAAATATPISIGENFMGPEQMAVALAAQAADFVMPDVQRIMGVTGWMRAAALAQAYGLDMSSHLFPEFSRHLLAVTPTAHWLEYVDWADPILREPLRITDGVTRIDDEPGAGVQWNEDAVERYKVLS